MTRARKPSGRLSSGPWTAADFGRALRADGWVVESPGPHTHYVHPAKRGKKVTVDQKWTGVKKGHDPFKGIAAQAGYTPRQLQRLLNRC